jgi:hypothetical protein
VRASLAVPRRHCWQGAGFTVVAADAISKALGGLPEGIGREVGGTTGQAAAKTLIDRIAGQAGPLRFS